MGRGSKRDANSAKLVIPPFDGGGAVVWYDGDQHVIRRFADESSTVLMRRGRGEFEVLTELILGATLFHSVSSLASGFQSSLECKVSSEENES